MRRDALVQGRPWARRRWVRVTTVLDGVQQLVAVVTRLADARSIDEVAHIVRRAARRLVGADGATFVLREGDQCHYLDEDAVGPLWKGQRFPAESCVSGWAMRHRRPAVVVDIDTDDRVPAEIYRSTFVRSLVVVPIRTADPIGAIGAYWADRYEPSPWELTILQALADSTALAITNALLVDEHRDRRPEPIDTLEELRAFNATVAHDLRAPVAAIRGLIGLLTGQWEHELGEHAKEIAAAADRAVTKLSELLGDLLTYAAVSELAPDVQVIRTEVLVDEVVERLAADVDEADAVITWSGSEQLQGDRVLVAQLLQNLLQNAITYTRPGRRPTVTVRVDDRGGSWELSVEDDGPGIPLSEREAVLQPLRRGSTSGGREGTGLGLAIAHGVARAHGGSIEIEGGVGTGTRVRVLLPKRSPS